MSILKYALVAVLALGVSLAAEEKGKPEAKPSGDKAKPEAKAGDKAKPEDKAKVEPKACDVKKVENAKYCAACDLVDPKDEKGKCKECQGAITEVPVCVKAYQRCGGCQKVCPDDKKSCCKDAKIEKVTDKCRVHFRCEGCQGEGKKAGEACPAEACKKASKKTKAVCEHSGTFPHGGTAQ